MTRNLLFLFVLFTGSARFAAAWGQAPVLTAPKVGEIVSTAGFLVEVAPNPGANFTHIYIYDLVTGTQYAASPRYYEPNPTRYWVPSGMRPDTPYEIRVQAYSATFAVSSTFKTVTTASTLARNALTVAKAPAEGEIVPASGFIVHLEGNPFCQFTHIYVKNLVSNVQHSASPRFGGTGDLYYQVPGGLTPDTPYEIKIVPYYVMTATVVNVRTAGALSSNTWTGSISAAWNEPANWSSGAVPTADQDVTIASAAHAPVLDVSRSVRSFAMTAGSLDLGGHTLTIAGNATFAAGRIHNGAVQGSGKTTKFGTAAGGPRIEAAVAISSTMLEVNHTAFLREVQLTLNSPYASINNGGNTFYGTTTLTNAGNSDWAWSTTGKDTFEGTLILRNAGARVLYLGNGSAGAECKGDILVGASHGGNVGLGTAAGSVILAEGKRCLAETPTGFSKGRLVFNKFKPSGSTGQRLVLSGSAAVVINPETVFEGAVHLEAPNIYLNGGVFGQTLVVIKTGGITNDCAGGNTFKGKLRIINQSPAGAALNLAAQANDEMLPPAPPLK